MRAATHIYNKVCAALIQSRGTDMSQHTYWVHDELMHVRSGAMAFDSDGNRAYLKAEVGKSLQARAGMGLARVLDGLQLHSC